jgi:phosphopantetheinyl transferase
VDTSGLDPDELSATWSDRLEEAELAKLANLRVDRDRRDYIAAHVLLRHGRSRFGEVPWSLSHTEGLAVCAFNVDGAEDVGVDAEPASAVNRLSELERLVVGSREREWLDSEPPRRPRRLVELWTGKEAYVKMRGVGFAAAGGFRVFQQLHMRPDDEVDGWRLFELRDDASGSGGRVWTTDVFDHLVAVAATTQGPPQLVAMEGIPER